MLIYLCMYRLSQEEYKAVNSDCLWGQVGGWVRGKLKNKLCVKPFIPFEFIPCTNEIGLLICAPTRQAKKQP